MSDATLARMEHGKYVGVRGEPRRDGVCVIRKPTLYRGDFRRTASGVPPHNGILGIIFARGRECVQHCGFCRACVWPSGSVGCSVLRVLFLIEDS